MTIKPWVYCDRCYAQIALSQAWAKWRAGHRVWLCDTCIAEAPSWGELPPSGDPPTRDGFGDAGTSDPDENI